MSRTFDQGSTRRISQVIRDAERSPRALTDEQWWPVRSGGGGRTLHTRPIAAAHNANATVTYNLVDATNTQVITNASVKMPPWANAAAINSRLIVSWDGARWGVVGSWCP
jgi:hypothetical protein